MPLTISLTRSGAQTFFARALYVFFGKPIRFLLPVLFIMAFGVYTAVSEKDSYRSVGSLAVSAETFLSDVTDVRTQQFSFETPASTISLQFNELMQTDGFAKSVVEGAGLGDVLDARGFNLDRIRVSIFAAAAGESLMRIVAVWDNPDWAEALANSAIAVFKNWVIDAEVRQSDVAESYYNELLTTYSDEVDSARSELETYLTEHEEPIDAREERPIEEQLEIERLNEALSRAQERFDDAIDKRELSRLATIQSSADIDQRLNVLDVPARPTASESGLRDMAITILLFGVLGSLFTLGIVAVATVLDRSVLSAADLEKLGVPVAAVVPRVKGMRIELSRLAVAPARDPMLQSAG